MQVREPAMYAIEFQTHVKGGIIRIPPQYQEQLQNSVRVIILVEPPSPPHTLIDQLLANPLHVPDFQPLDRDALHSRTNLEELDALTDEMIDTSEIPPLTEVFFATAQWRVPQSKGE